VTACDLEDLAARLRAGTLSREARRVLIQRSAHALMSQHTYEQEQGN
jgi:hypothetical protein